MERSAGMLLPLFSLPGPYGIGTLGREAYAFADFLHAAKQRYWQVLPCGPTGYGDSPYQSLSGFAGNPYLIDLELLIEDDLLRREEAEELVWGEDPRCIDYGRLYDHRQRVLSLAKERGWQRDRESVAEFVRENARWLPDWALFVACKRHFGMRSWLDWPDEALRRRQPEALAYYGRILQEDVECAVYQQYLFDRQWTALRSYCHARGIQIIGDLPMYVALDSADVWAEQEWFQLDERGVPTALSGVPPDDFSADGQLWGNPLYRWDAMQKDGFGWWIRRIGAAARRYDVIRMDHFRGFDAYWAVPFGATSARYGRWEPGPGAALIDAWKGWFPRLPVIAEDLGVFSPGVSALLQHSGWPGMKVLAFAFSPDGCSSHLPHWHTCGSVCYTGTHDNSPLPLWLREISPEEYEFARRYLGLHGGEGFSWGILRGGMSSVAQLFVAQMQDYLTPEQAGRINCPGTGSGNWCWRLLPGEASAALAEKIGSMTVRYGRASPMA